MNENIKHIWQQASASHVKAITSKQTQENFIIKFSELLVQDCLDSLTYLRGYSGVGEDGNPYDTSSWNAALAAAQNNILDRLNK